MCQEVMLRDVHTMAVEVGNILHAMRGLLDAGRLASFGFCRSRSEKRPNCQPGMNSDSRALTTRKTCR